MGIAIRKSFGSYAAEVVEGSGDPENGTKIEKVTRAVDCGIAVNPDIVRAQMEGGIGYGVGHEMRDQITLASGAVDQFNFPVYEPLRNGDFTEIDVHFVQSAEAPTGVGEPGAPPSFPALTNAINALSGFLVAELSMAENGVSFVLRPSLRRLFRRRHLVFYPTTYNLIKFRDKRRCLDYISENESEGDPNGPERPAQFSCRRL
ncbi:molybdopterin cofactor-binding domain-containing protein [Ruegeria lacuscaerulensis]|uniref:molybdopterin cofactor-binding domain-containing protein n=1 Tax=Ruegeria lacuscaerulensis TaxID=55218 RepID=UPI001480F34C|nr:molybdopterin cofactor-binding domain-containing protein [Ruegeria lacuscaerulensis]